MGGYINSQADAEICEVLNKRFSNELNASKVTHLNELRAFFNGHENLFDTGRKLNRVFHRLAISVTGGTSVPKNDHSRWRWFHLLKSNLPADVETAIRGQLTAILSPAKNNPPGGVDYVVFSTVHQDTHSGDQFELWDGVRGGVVSQHFNNPSPTPLSDANGNTYCALILACKEDKKLDDAPGEDDPPGRESNEKGDIPFGKPKAIAAKKSRSTGKSVKKTAKKTTKKNAK
jgi:hypothetical protein